MCHVSQKDAEPGSYADISQCTRVEGYIMQLLKSESDCVLKLEKV